MRHAQGGATATPEPSADHQLMAVLMDSPFPLQEGALGAVMGAFGSAVGACGTIGVKSMRWKSIGVKGGAGQPAGRVAAAAGAGQSRAERDGGQHWEHIGGQARGDEGAAAGSRAGDTAAAVAAMG